MTQSEFIDRDNKIIDPPPHLLGESLGNNPNKEDLRIKTEQWLAGHPNIYALYKRFAYELLKKGRRFSAKLITERIRWEMYFEFNEEFKISNDYTAYIARKLAQDIPELQGVLKFKKTRW